MKTLKIKKGLNIKLKGVATQEVASITSHKYALHPEDFHGVMPKLLVKVGDQVKAGQAVFCDKKHPEVCFTAPVGGTVADIVRGEKRRILRVEIDKSESPESKTFDTQGFPTFAADRIKAVLLQAGCWPFLRQRPYDIIPNTDATPKAIFISFCDTQPLPIDQAFALSSMGEYLQAGVDALSKLTEGKVHLGLPADHPNHPAKQLKNASLYAVSGKHPAGNVGVHIHHIDPIDKGEQVWTLTPAALMIIGRLFATGIYNPTLRIALCGSRVDKPQYIETQIGVHLPSLLKDRLTQTADTRIISGGVLTGTTVGEEGYLRFYDDKVIALPEGNHYDFMGWLRPIFDKVSLYRANIFPSARAYDLDTNTNGEERALVMTGIYDKVFPMDILPGILLKSMMYEDIEEMESLGIYEIVPEDYAMAEFVCPSKTPCQQIVRESLDMMIREVG